MKRLLAGIFVAILGATWYPASAHGSTPLRLSYDSIWFEIEAFQDTPDFRAKSTFGTFRFGSTNFQAGLPLGVNIKQTGSFARFSPEMKQAVEGDKCEFKFKLLTIDSFWDKVVKETELGSVPLHIEIKLSDIDRSLFGSNAEPVTPFVSPASRTLATIPFELVNVSNRLRAELWCGGQPVLDSKKNQDTTLAFDSISGITFPKVSFNSSPSLTFDTASATYQGFLGASAWVGNGPGTSPNVSYSFLACLEENFFVLGQDIFGTCKTLATGKQVGETLVTPRYRFSTNSGSYKIIMIVKASNTWSNAYRNSNTLDLLVVTKKPLVTKSTGSSKYAATKYASCSALNKRFSGGLRKSSATKNKGATLKITPFTSAIGYSKNSHLDRDRDGIACEK